MMMISIGKKQQKEELLSCISLNNMKNFCKTASQEQCQEC